MHNNSMESFEITLKAYAMLDKEAKSSQGGARVFVPKEWAGKRVRVLLLDPIEDEK